MVHHAIPADWYPIEVTWDDHSAVTCASAASLYSEVEWSFWPDQIAILHNRYRERVYYRVVRLYHFPRFLRILDIILNDAELEFSTVPFVA